MGYIYKIENTINHKLYIGQTHLSIYDRFKKHKEAAKEERTQHLKLYKAFKKYGTENFVVSLIEECDDSLLGERETYWINYYDTYHNGYNMTLGGEGTIYYDVAQILSLYNQGCTFQEISNKLSCSKQTVLYNLKNHISSEEIKNRADIARSTTNKKNNKFKHGVVMYNLQGEKINEFDSLAEACRQTHISTTEIASVCNLKRFTTHNYSFRWKERATDNIIIPEKYNNMSQQVTAYDVFSETTFCSKVEAMRTFKDYYTYTEKTAVKKLTKAIKNNTKLFGYYWKEG